MRITVLSDTHGLLRPEVPPLVRGSDLILHAGDVGDPDILDQLGEIAPVVAVRGNMDGSGAVARLPATAEGELAGLPYRMVHRREDIPDSWRRDARSIFYGHSHRPEIDWHGDCLLLNPGAIGPRRFKLPLTLARLTVTDGRIVPEILAVE